MNLDDLLQQELSDRRQQSLYRQRKIIETPQQIHLKINGRSLLSFCSNDYLGLASHPDIAAALKKGVDRWGVGSGAAHLVSGHTAVHHELEEALAGYTGRSRALLFSTGYMANLGVVNALMGKGDLVVEDRLNHASLIDAALLSSALSGSVFKRYPHNNVERLELWLAESEPQARKLVISDSVFSMDGVLADVPELVRVCQDYDAWLMLDDAHGFGLLGEQGAGVAQEFHLDQQQLPVYMATLGKAMGVAGAFVTGSDALIETLIQKARSFIYTTAMPPALASALLVSLKIARQENWRREKLKALIAQFRSGCEQLGLKLLDSMTAIQPVLTGSIKNTVQLSQALEEQGILVTAIRPPTVPKGTSRLRVTLSAQHSEQDIERLLNAFADLGMGA